MISSVRRLGRGIWGAALATVLVAETGSFVASGQDVSFRLDMGAVQGSFQANGQTANFSISMVSGEGEFSLSGQDVLYALSMAVSSGMFNLSGQDVEVPTVEIEIGGVSIAIADLSIYVDTQDVGYHIATSAVTGNYVNEKDVGYHTRHIREGVVIGEIGILRWGLTQFGSVGILGYTPTEFANATMALLS